MPKRGRTTKSPKFKANMKREAEQNESKAPPKQCTAESMEELRQAQARKRRKKR